MPLEDNQTIAMRWVDGVFNNHNTSIIDELLAPDFVDKSALPPGVPGTREGVKQSLTLMLQAFPDLHTRVDDILTVGDQVVARQTSTATHRGNFMGIPATGKQVTWQGIHIIRLRGGKITEHWGLVDNLGLLQQLGVGPQLPLGEQQLPPSDYAPDL